MVCSLLSSSNSNYSSFYFIISKFFFKSDSTRKVSILFDRFRSSIFDSSRLIWLSHVATSSLYCACILPIVYCKSRYSFSLPLQFSFHISISVFNFVTKNCVSRISIYLLVPNEFSRYISFSFWLWMVYSCFYIAMLFSHIAASCCLILLSKETTFCYRPSMY